VEIDDHCRIFGRRVDIVIPQAAALNFDLSDATRDGLKLIRDSLQEEIDLTRKNLNKWLSGLEIFVQELSEDYKVPSIESAIKLHYYWNVLNYSPKDDIDESLFKLFADKPDPKALYEALENEQHSNYDSDKNQQETDNTKREYVYYTLPLPSGLKLSSDSIAILKKKLMMLEQDYMNRKNEVEAMLTTVKNLYDELNTPSEERINLICSLDEDYFNKLSLELKRLRDIMHVVVEKAIEEEVYELLAQETTRLEELHVKCSKIFKWMLERRQLIEQAEISERTVNQMFFGFEKDAAKGSIQKQAKDNKNTTTKRKESKENKSTPKVPQSRSVSPAASVNGDQSLSHNSQSMQPPVSPTYSNGSRTRNSQKLSPSNSVPLSNSENLPNRSRRSSKAISRSVSPAKSTTSSRATSRATSPERRVTRKRSTNNLSLTPPLSPTHRVSSSDNSTLHPETAAQKTNKHDDKNLTASRRSSLFLGKGNATSKRSNSVSSTSSESSSVSSVAAPSTPTTLTPPSTSSYIVNGHLSVPVTLSKTRKETDKNTMIKITIDNEDNKSNVSLIPAKATKATTPNTASTMPLARKTNKDIAKARPRSVV
ncbi:3465_t:CDS:2, partial [Racocetra fulgida]